TPGRHGSKLEQIVHNTASVCVRVQMEGLPALGSQLSKSIEPPDRRSRRRREEAIQACTRSRRKECISHSPARDKMTMQTGMYAVQKTEKNMSRHLSMSVGALDRERCCRRANLELAAAHWRARHRSEARSSDHRPRSLLLCAGRRWDRPAQVGLLASPRMQARPPPEPQRSRRSVRSRAPYSPAVACTLVGAAGAMAGRTLAKPSHHEGSNQRSFARSLNEVVGYQ